ncbi:MAG: glycosyltransferase, partial [Candidatus Brocadiales bacterium]
PGAFVVLVGPHVSALPEESLRLGIHIDAVALREYDFTILDVVKTLENEGNMEDTAGLVIRRDGTLLRTKDRGLPENLDEIPYVSKVYRKHLDYRKYFYSHSRYPIVTIITGRGCPHQCVYCAYPQVFSSRKVRYRSVENVVDEIEEILGTYPDVQEIMFEDDTLTLDKKRCLRLSEEILKRNLKFCWSANSRADVDYETLKTLKNAGCRLLCVGIESGDQGVLDGMKKHLSVDKIRQFFKDARKAGVLIHGCFLVGNPGETKETLATTLGFAKELSPDTAQFFPIMVYPGTAAYNWARENHYLLTHDFIKWLTEEGLHNCVVSRPGLTNFELVEFCDRARREFYTRPGYIFSKSFRDLDIPQSSKGYTGVQGLYRSIYTKTMQTDLSISVIVPAYNARFTIGACLESLVSQNFSGSYEIIVVDDGSTDNTSGIVSRYKGVKLLKQDNQGPASARNLGAKAAEGEIILFTDSDCVPQPDWLEEMVRPFTTDKDIVGVKGAYRTAQKGLVPRFVQYEYENKYDLLRKNRYIDFVDTYSAGFKKEILLGAGGYDTSFPVACTEDMDLSYRLSTLGYKMVFNPGAVVYHIHPESLRQYIKKKYKFAYWGLFALRKTPQKIKKDSYNPQCMKIQVLLAPLILFSGIITPFYGVALWVLLCLAGCYLLVSLPFLVKTLVKDPIVGLASPFLLFMRSLAQGGGLTNALLRMLSPPLKGINSLLWGSRVKPF